MCEILHFHFTQDLIENNRLGLIDAEMGMRHGSISLTHSNPTHQLSDPTQLN